MNVCVCVCVCVDVIFVVCVCVCWCVCMWVGVCVCLIFWQLPRKIPWSQEHFWRAFQSWGPLPLLPPTTRWKKNRQITFRGKVKTSKTQSECKTPQHTTTYRDTLQHTATHWKNKSCVKWKQNKKPLHYLERGKTPNTHNKEWQFQSWKQSCRPMPKHFERWGAGVEYHFQEI